MFSFVGNKLVTKLKNFSLIDRFLWYKDRHFFHNLSQVILKSTITF